VLDRGFAILRDERGTVVTDVATLAPGAVVEATLARGGAHLLVERTRPHDS
jgi:exonuclease VII large subunit